VSPIVWWAGRVGGGNPPAPGEISPAHHGVKCWWELLLAAPKKGHTGCGLDGGLPMMTVRVQSVFDCPPEKVWAELQTSALHREIIRPLMRFRSLDVPGPTEHWTQGCTFHFRTYLFGVIPLGKHTIFIERIDPVAREVQSREHGALVRRWDHLIRIRPTPDGHTLYSDEVEFSAGPLTPLVWAFAQWFYHHRQRRWRRIARRLASAGPADGSSRADT
jgi:hypothetical protein